MFYLSTAPFAILLVNELNTTIKFWNIFFKNRAFNVRKKLRNIEFHLDATEI